MIRIAIDGNEANVHNRVGSNRYAYEILCALEKQTRGRSELEFTILLATPSLPDLPPTRPGWSYRVVKPTFFWTQLALPLHLYWNGTKYDVLFTPGHYGPRRSPVPYVSSVMDLAFLEYPEQFRKKDLVQLTDWTAYSVARAAKIITISQASKQDILATYHRTARDVVVAYPAVSALPEPAPSAHHQTSILRKLGLKRPYILYVGTLQPRKNLVRLMQAYELLAQRWPKRQHAKLPQLVIAGKEGWLAAPITKHHQASPHKKDIILTGYISDEVKDVLYRHATASVLVGLSEGFGIPPLESMQYGVVPVVSASSSLPEVVGRGGIQVDPWSVEAIAEGLHQAVTASTKQKAIWRNYMTQQLAKFSWDASAERVLSTLESVARHH